MDDSAPSMPTGSSAALVVLLALAATTPWSFGGTHPLVLWLISQVCLLTCGGIALLRLWRREGVEIPLPAALGAGIFLLGVLQLIPLPPALHQGLAPGSAVIWHPLVSSAADVLGRNAARPTSIWPDATRRAIGAGIGLIALAVLSVPALRDRSRALGSATFVVASGTCVAVYGLIARVAFGDKLFGTFAVPTLAPFGPFVSKNHFAGYVEMTALLALGLATGIARVPHRSSRPLDWTESRRAPWVVLAYGAFALLSLGVLSCLSRGGVVSLGVGVAVFIALHSAEGGPARRWRARSGATLVVILGTVAALSVVPSEVRDRLRSIGAGDSDPSTAFRGIVWRDSLRLAASSPLIGHGLGTFADALPPFKTGAGDVRVEHAESDYLELVADEGFLGLLAIAGLVFSLAGRVQTVRRETCRAVRSLRLGAVSGLAALAVHSLVDFNLRIPSNALLCCFLAALVLAAGASRTLRLGGLVAMGSLVGITIVLVPSPLKGGTSAADLMRVFNSPSHGATMPLRVRTTAQRLEDELRRRPASAESWLRLAWVRGVSGHFADARQLADYAVSLDPQHAAVRAARRQLPR